MSLLYAAAHPDRVERLILHGAILACVPAVGGGRTPLPWGEVLA